MSKRGTLIKNGCSLKSHEQVTVDFLLFRGFTIELIPTSSVPGDKTADIVMDGVACEIKAPQGNSKWTIGRNLKRARRQSQIMVIDLFRCRRFESQAIREIRNYFDKTHSVKRIMIITKRRHIIDLKH